MLMSFPAAAGVSDIVDHYVQAAKVRKVLILPRLNERERNQFETTSRGTITTITTWSDSYFHEIEDVDTVTSNWYETGASSVTTYLEHSEYHEVDSDVESMSDIHRTLAFTFSDGIQLHVRVDEEFYNELLVTRSFEARLISPRGRARELNEREATRILKRYNIPF